MGIINPEKYIDDINGFIEDAWEYSVIKSNDENNIRYAIDCWSKLYKLEQYLLKEDKQQWEHGIVTIKEIMKIIS